MFGLNEVLGLLTKNGKGGDGFKGKFLGQECKVLTFAAKPQGTKKVKLFVKIETGEGRKHIIDAVYDTTSGQPDRDVVQINKQDVSHEDIKFGYGAKGQLFPPKLVLWAKLKFSWNGSISPQCEVEYQKAVGP